ncbi:MAG: phage holin family protein [Candidatus Acidiferrales bacterium]
MPLQSQRSVPEVLQDIVANLQEIIRSEFRLATTEIKEEGARTFKKVATFGAGIVFAIYALGFLLLTIVYALSTVVAPWLAALLVTVLVGLPGIVFINLGRERLKQVNLMPDKTIASVKENVQWAKKQIK